MTAAQAKRTASQYGGSGVLLLFLLMSYADLRDKVADLRGEVASLRAAVLAGGGSAGGDAGPGEAVRDPGGGAQPAQAAWGADGRGCQIGEQKIASMAAYGP